MAHIIGIGGASQSGKSTLAKQLKDRASGQSVLILEMDDLVSQKESIPTIQGRTDWERPESVDLDRIISTIENFRDDYDVIIVEGILAFANNPLKNLYDFTIILQISKETFLERRAKETRWGVEPEWYWEHVWNSYLLYGQYPQADFILSAENDIPKEALDQILQKSAEKVLAGARS